MNKRIQELVEQTEYNCRNKKHHLERIHNREITIDEYKKIYNEKFVELILIEVIATIYGSDIKDKKQDKLVDKLLYKFGMFSETKE